MRDVDEPALLANRGDRLGEGEPAGNLALEEEADHFALIRGLHLFTGNDDDVVAARRVHRLERAAEHVVIGDRDCADSLVFGVVHKLRRINAAIEGPRRVHVQVGDDPRPVGERLGRLARPAALGQPGIEGVELGCDAVERFPFGVRPRSLLLALAELVVLGQAGSRGGGELRLFLEARRVDDRAARGFRLEQDTRETGNPRHDDRRAREERRPRRSVARSADVHA